jgi:hypothetical protein
METLTDVLNSYNNKKLCKIRELLLKIAGEDEKDIRLPQELEKWFVPRDWSVRYNRYSNYKLLHAIRRIERIMVIRFINEN